MRIPYAGTYVIPVVVLLLFTGCREEIVPEEFQPGNAHEAYQHALEEAGLSGTALGRDWIEKAQDALDSPVNIELPYEEVFYWDRAEAEAEGYRFFVKRGLRVEVVLEAHSADSLLYFADLFREQGDSIKEYFHVATAEENSGRMEFEPRRDSYYLFRLQSELLRGGRFRVMIREVPSLAFPVTGRSSRNIQSFFGAPRDGGSRAHHGVDIFAPRHTPVTAPVSGRITRVDVGEIGGNYVWLRDEQRSLHLYFAHLQTQEVEVDQQVVAGQIIGTVGNTGNARTTPTHLHFGIYQRGPIDPFYFIAETDTVPERIRGDSLLLGQTVRTNREAYIRTIPVLNGEIRDTMEAHSLMQVTAMTGRMYRVLLPDGTSGYIRENQVEPVRDTLSREVISESLALLEIPDPDAVIIASILPGDQFEVLGRYKAFLFGATSEGRRGWIRML